MGQLSFHFHPVGEFLGMLSFTPETAWTRCAIAFASLACLCYIWIHTSRQRKSHSNNIPYAIPSLRGTIPFIFNGLEFLQRSRQNFPKWATFRISIIRDDIFIIQGPKNAGQLFHDARLSVTTAYSLVLGQCFGMKRQALDVYNADTSGSRQKPILGSNLEPQDRISFMTHESLRSGLLKEGLGPAFHRFREYLSQSLLNAEIGDEWVECPDMSKFFEKHLGTSLVRTLFGEELLAQHPGFVEDLWEYDKGVMNLIRGLPRFLTLRTHRIRDRLVRSVERWHEKASDPVSCPKESNGFSDQSLWGSDMMKERYHMLLATKGQDAKSVAITDLALIWASVTNVAPSTMTLALHVLSSSSLLSSLRTSLSSTGPLPSIESLESIPLLLSMYAETLRFGVQVHIPRIAPHHELTIGGATIPRNKLMMANTWLMHMDDTLWNTKGGEKPLDEFWAERFLVDPEDPTSGPGKTAGPRDGEKGVHFSTADVEGAWIPYGGGHHACPGRLLSKRIMLFSTAMLINMFDIEIISRDSIKFDSPKFGLGVRKPRGRVRFRMRRRR
ncbi:cytochrome P450 [Hypoxylon cercidicola]|nr:cytochrome P450 [Hypoxylon cercidicola]